MKSETEVRQMLAILIGFDFRRICHQGLEAVLDRLEPSPLKFETSSGKAALQ
jgi:hypothetical protein